MANYQPDFAIGMAKANALTLDANANVYVAGSSNNDVLETDTLVIKYDTNGNELWVVEPGNGGDAAFDIAVDSAGNVYTVGKQRLSPAFTMPTTMFVRKHNGATGATLWTTLYSQIPQGSTADRATAIALSSTDVPYVTGVTCSNDLCFNGQQITTMRLHATTGEQIWFALEDHGIGNGIAHGPSGRTYVASKRNDAFTTVRYGTTLLLRPALLKVLFDLLTTSETKTITLSNTGGEDLVVRELAFLSQTGVPDGCNAFRMSVPRLPFTLPPGQRTLLRLTFEPPRPGTYACGLRLVTNDDVRGDVELALRGTLGCDGQAATLQGTPGNDVLTGTEGDDVIVGLGGHDIIDGRGGNDVICGGEGDDVLLGGRGNDRLFGGDGNDILDGGEGDDALFGEAGTDWLLGGPGHDLLDGGSDTDGLEGGDGNDMLFGGDGDDILDGGEDDDILHGGAGKDWLRGGPGNDTLLGEADDDGLEGGAGRDVCDGGPKGNSDSIDPTCESERAVQ